MDVTRTITKSGHVRTEPQLSFQKTGPASRALMKTAPAAGVVPLDDAANAIAGLGDTASLDEVIETLRALQNTDDDAVNAEQEKKPIDDASSTAKAMMEKFSKYGPRNAAAMTLKRLATHDVEESSFSRVVDKMYGEAMAEHTAKCAGLAKSGRRAVVRAPKRTDIMTKARQLHPGLYQLHLAGAHKVRG